MPIILLVLPLLLTTKPLDPNELNRQGVQANARGDYAKAVEYFRQALALEPAQAPLRYNLFHALNNLSIQAAGEDEAERAIKACSEALQLVPEDIRIASNLAIFFHNRAVDLLGKGHYEEARGAISDAQKVVDEFGLGTLSTTIRETHARTFLLQGREKFERNEVAEALDLYDRCIQTNPEEALAYLDRSRIYYEQDFFQDAIADLELAAEILGQPPQVLSLLQRLKIEARDKGITLSDEESFFVLEIPGASASQEQAIKRILKDLRLRVARTLTVNPKKSLLISIRLNDVFVPVQEWIATPGNKVDPDRISLGMRGIDLASEDFLRMLRFQYVAALLQGLGGESLPYWFAVGLAQYLADEATRPPAEETEQLLVAGENFLLFRVEDLAVQKLTRIEDSKQVRLAHLESKALVVQLIDTIRMNGLRQLMRSLLEGVSFEQALRDIGNLSAQDIEREWRTSLGLPPG